MKKGFFYILICFFGISTLTACTARTSEPVISKSFSDFNKEQTLLLELHNEERNGMNLELDKNLCHYSQRHAKKMADNNYLYHSSMSKLLKESGASYVGENIAWGQETEEEVVRAWMNSYGHRKNILNKHYKKVGFGISKDKNGSIYWCAVFSN